MFEDLIGTFCFARQNWNLGTRPADRPL